MRSDPVHVVYREVRDSLICCKLSLASAELTNSLIYRYIVCLIDYLNDLL